jgi:6-pyruvoyltetrahydropterin/6-carboxytetrahydropterin synthase
MYTSTKFIELGSCAFRQYGATHSHCQYLHGYQLKAKFWFGCKELDEKNWVVDFGDLKDLKKILNDQFDHTLCIASDDPELELFKTLEAKGACVLRIMPKGVGIERTAEWAFNAAQDLINQKYGDRCWVEKVEVFEHENNSALYERPKPITVQSITYNELGNLNNISKTHRI